MKSITLGSTQIHSNDSDIGFFVSPEIQGLEDTDIRLSSYSVPGLDGGYVSSQRKGMRPITLVGKVYASDTDTYRSRRRTLELSTNIQRSDDVLSPITMKFTTMDDLDLQIDVYKRKLGFPEKNMMSAVYKLDLLGISEIVSQTLQSESIYIFNGGGMAIPMTIPMDMSGGGGNSTTVTNNGNSESFPTLTFHGPLENPSLTNSTTGQGINILYTLNTQDDYIVIDIKNRTARAYINGSNEPVNIKQYVSGDWMTIGSGQNLLALGNANYNATARCVVVFRDTYLGV